MLWTRDLLTSAAPAPLSPADGATVSGATVNLAWSAVPGAVTYELELSAQSTFDPVLFDRSDLHGTSVTVSQGELPAGTSIVYWRTRVSSPEPGSMWAPTRSFSFESADAGVQVTLVLRVGSTVMTQNGKPVTLDAAPRIVGGRTLLPIKWVAEPLGATVTWNAADRKATVQLGTNIIELWIGKGLARVNGHNAYIDPGNTTVAPIILNGRTMVPVRFVAEQLGADIEWDATSATVTITGTAP